LLIGVGLVLAYGVLVVIQPDPWFAPQFWIPLGSALLAHGLNGGAIASEQFLRALQRNRQEIETHLSLGATPGQAVSPHRRGALRAALLPNVQTVAIAGLGNLPLFMSGQLVAGADPLGAVIYELLLVLMLLGAGAIVASVLCAGIERLSFTPLAQLKEI
jgi:putative ABC transport system permease protein